MKKTMNILEFYEFLKGQPNHECYAIYDAVDGVIPSICLFRISDNQILIIGHFLEDSICGITDTFTVDVPDFIPKWDDLKEVEYFGKKFLVPEDTKWLAVDSSGLLHAYKAKDAPLAWGSCFSSYADYISIAFLEYDGDWTKSLVEV